MQLASLIHEAGQQVTTDYQADGAVICAELDQATLNRIIKAGGGNLTYEILDQDEDA